MNKHILSSKDFNSLMASICRQIALTDWRPDYIVGITRGGLLPAVMISHYFDIPMHGLKVSLRDGDNDCESNLWMSEDAFNKKNILIVDDINDTGSTFNWIMKDWRTNCCPHDLLWENDIWNSNVKFATVVDNLTSKCSVGMDFWGMEINKEENPVWIEFPYENWWRK